MAHFRIRKISIFLWRNQSVPSDHGTGHLKHYAMQFARLNVHKVIAKCFGGLTS